MQFNSFEFIFFFGIVILSIGLIKHKKFQHTILLMLSYFFFYYTSNYLIILLIISTVLDFYLGNFIFNTSDLRKKKIILMISIIVNLGLLGFFKYSDFAILQFNFIGEQINIGNNIPLLELVLPIGISFYTFQTMSYTIDIYRGKIYPCKSFREFALFVAFFPQLVAGPIVRAKDFLPQLREKIEDGSDALKKIIINNSNLKLGITIMMFGFIKKMFFADNIAPLVNNIFSNPIGMDSFTIILGAIGFGIQIYGDFSGYSDIAIGAALILGFKLPINFNKPYFATSPADFWRRWHISLSTWLRDYLYIPLGGNRKSESRTYLNLLTVMFLGGLWHGASWNFVIWGILHGTYLSVHKIILNRFPYLNELNFFKTKLGKFISIIITQYLVFLAWIPFRVENFENLKYSLTKYILIDFELHQFLSIISENKIAVSLLILFIILHIFTFRNQDIIKKIAYGKNITLFLFLTFSIMLILLMYNGNPEQFIYFRF